MPHKIDERCAALAKSAKAAIEKDPSRTEEILKRLYLQAWTDMEKRYKTHTGVDTDGRMKDFFAIPHEDN